MAEIRNDEAAAQLLSAVLQRAVSDLELLRTIGRETFERQLAMSQRHGGPGRNFFGARKSWRVGGENLSVADMEAIVGAPAWVRGEQCARWCEMIEIDHEAFVAELEERRLL